MMSPVKVQTIAAAPAASGDWLGEQADAARAMVRAAWWQMVGGVALVGAVLVVANNLSSRRR